MKFIVNWLDQDGHPNSTIMEGDLRQNKIELDSDWQQPVGTQVWMYPIKDLYRIDDIYNDQTIAGELSSTSPAIIEVIEQPKGEDQSLMTLVQRRIPDANRFIEEYNSELASTVLDTITKGEITTSVGGVINSQLIEIEHRAGTLVSKLPKDTILMHHIHYTSIATLSVDYSNTIYQIEVFLHQIEEEGEGWIEIIPLKIQYGKGSNLETHHYDTKIRSRKIVTDKLIKSMTFWFRALRTPQYLITLLSIVVALVMTELAGFNVNRINIALIILGTFCVQAGGNMLNDYFDHKSELDEINIVPSTSPTSNKFIQDNLIHPVTALTMGFVLFSIGAVIGLYLNAITPGQIVLLLGVIGAITTYFYTGEPLKLAYRGVGEFILALNFGPLIIIGTYYVMTKTLPTTDQILIFTAPPLLFVAGLLILNEIDDIEADRLVDKMTTAVRFGRENSLLLVLFLLIIAINISITTMTLSFFQLFLLVLVFIVGSVTLIKPYQETNYSPKLEMYTASYILWTIVVLLALTTT